MLGGSRLLEEGKEGVLQVGRRRELRERNRKVFGVGMGGVIGKG